MHNQISIYVFFRSGLSNFLKAFSLLFMISCAHPERPQDSVLLIINKNSAISQKIGSYYQKKRKIAKLNVCSVDAPVDEEIDREIYNKNVKLPISDFLKSRRIEGKILYIVTTKGLPLRISGFSGPSGDRASLDSELSSLYRELIGIEYPLEGGIPNPYYNADPDFKGGHHFNRADFDIYMVTRLTGYNLEDVKGLIDRSLKPQATGKLIFDMNGDNASIGNIWMRKGYRTLRNMGFEVFLERSTKYVTGERDVLGYSGWGSNDPNCSGRFLGNLWQRGALALIFVSTSARTFDEPPEDWTTGEWNNTFYGSPQSLIADLINEGVTGTAGYVYEPYLETCVQPDILFPAYLSGYNLAESFYMATRYLSWQTVIVGDPLCKINDTQHPSSKID